MVTSQKNFPRGRGRPRTARNLQRNRLLQAAGELLSGSQSGDLALRQVALRAGVTPALAHYYFANRDGLLMALIEERATPKIDELISAAQTRAALPVGALTWLMQRLAALTAGDSLLCRCLLLPTALPLRNRLRALLLDLLASAQSQELLRTDLPAPYLADTLLGLCLFPCLDADITGNNPVECATARTLQHVALLQDGIVHGRRVAARGT